VRWSFDLSPSFRLAVGSSVPPLTTVYHTRG
jgi:hypothetical protein